MPNWNSQPRPPGVRRGNEPSGDPDELRRHSMCNTRSPRLSVNTSGDRDELRRHSISNPRSPRLLNMAAINISLSNQKNTVLPSIEHKPPKTPSPPTKARHEVAQLWGDELRPNSPRLDREPSPVVNGSPQSVWEPSHKPGIASELSAREPCHKAAKCPGDSRSPRGALSVYQPKGQIDASMAEGALPICRRPSLRACQGKLFAAQCSRNDAPLSPSFVFATSDAAQNVEFECAATSQKASSYPGGRDKPNQDSYATLVNLDHSPQFCLTSVCDGHGKNGHKASQIITDLLENLEPSLEPGVSITDEVLRVIQEGNTFLCKEPGLKMELSGTTCCTVLLTADRVHCFNIGDSRAVLCSVTEDGATEAEALSWDQKPCVESEAERIRSTHGEYISCVTGSDGKPCGPKRVWIGEEQKYGLGMSRSLGDKIAKDYGVIGTPVIEEGILEAGCTKAIIVGSDGLWEFVSNEKAASIALQERSADAAAGALREHATQCWLTEEGLAVDDITVLVMFLNVSSAREDGPK